MDDGDPQCLAVALGMDLANRSGQLLAVEPVPGGPVVRESSDESSPRRLGTEGLTRVDR